MAHTESYGQTAARTEPYGAPQQTSSAYDESVPYKRLIRKRRNSTSAQLSCNAPVAANQQRSVRSSLRNVVPPYSSSVHVADVDLPEQSLTVFGIEDGPPPSIYFFEIFFPN
ncbi:unnamed protein product [Gongylonema pulchrum]|uniref:Uncharacterized protein n=1 Tax=Gongylonema pulchrum TaxID=637853 RepID=A0A183EN12_9BILA|nr:unnamed protein product [Gongylonema pulchrum]